MKLSELMTAEQALKILEKLESIEKRIENLENENRAQEWKSIYRDLGLGNFGGIGGDDR